MAGVPSSSISTTPPALPVVSPAVMGDLSQNYRQSLVDQSASALLASAVNGEVTTVASTFVLAIQGMPGKVFVEPTPGDANPGDFTIWTVSANGTPTQSPAGGTSTPIPASALPSPVLPPVSPPSS